MLFKIDYICIIPGGCRVIFGRQSITNDAQKLLKFNKLHYWFNRLFESKKKQTLRKTHSFQRKQWMRMHLSQNNANKYQ